MTSCAGAARLAGAQPTAACLPHFQVWACGHPAHSARLITTFSCSSTRLAPLDSACGVLLGRWVARSAGMPCRASQASQQRPGMRQQTQRMVREARPKRKLRPLLGGSSASSIILPVPLSQLQAVAKLPCSALSASPPWRPWRSPPAAWLLRRSRCRCGEIGHSAVDVSNSWKLEFHRASQSHLE